ncbi:MAG: alpha/beta fold hydrolase [Sphingomonadales bacterium]
MLEPTSKTYRSAGLALHYADWGNEDAPPLILIHGGRDHCRNWDWVARDLCSDFHVVAPDLRGHGDSQWSPDGDYSMASYLFDFAEFVRGQGRPVTIIGHSLGGNIAIRFAGTYPETVTRLVAIEGLRPPPDVEAKRASQSIAERLREWIEERRRLGERKPRRYASVEDALARMQAMNRHLSDEQARHLTVHGVRRNDDGSYSWKFDEQVRSFAPIDLATPDVEYLYGAIECPTLLVYGRDSWATNPAKDGRLDHFRYGRVAMFDDAGHWVHHDRLDAFLAEVRAFLAA